MKKSIVTAEKYLKAYDSFTTAASLAAAAVPTHFGGKETAEQERKMFEEREEERRMRWRTLVELFDDWFEMPKFYSDEEREEINAARHMWDDRPNGYGG